MPLIFSSCFLKKTGKTQFFRSKHPPKKTRSDSSHQSLHHHQTGQKTERWGRGLVPWMDQLGAAVWQANWTFMNRSVSTWKQNRLNNSLNGWNMMKNFKWVAFNSTFMKLLCNMLNLYPELLSFYQNFCQVGSLVSASHRILRISGSSRLSPRISAMTFRTKLSEESGNGKRIDFPWLWRSI